jgi:hypothetical protein
MEFYSENLKGRDCSGGLSIERRRIIKMIWKKWDVD